MKLRKIMAGIVAASAQYDAFVMYASGNWYPALIADASGHFEDPNSGAVTEWTSGTAEVTKDGTYTVSLSNIKGTGVDEETGEETLLPAACVFRQTYAASYILRSALTLLTVHGL